MDFQSVFPGLEQMYEFAIPTCIDYLTRRLDMLKIRILALAAALIAAASCTICSYASAADKATAEAKLLDVLKSSASVADKCNACRGLKTIGTEKSVPALAALLTDGEISHCARIALESLPCPAAGTALREALAKATGLTKAGIIDSLGERRDAQAVPLLQPALEDKDLSIVAAAADALGKIGTVEAAKALVAGRNSAKARVKIGAGLVRCANHLLKADKRDEAAKIYRDLSGPGEARVVRAGALRGLMQTSGPQFVTESLSNGDAQIRAAAAAELSNFSLADLKAAAAGMAKLPGASQEALLMAIRVRGEKSFAPIALAAVQSKDESVRIAAVRALATVGDATALPALVPLSAEKDKLGEAARQSLEAICGPNIDEGIVAALQAEKDPLRRADWIAVIESRRPIGGVVVLLRETAHQDPVVRSRAMAALAKLAGPSDVPAMVAVVLKAEKGPQRDDAERAVVLVCQQVADAEKRAEPALGVFRTAAAAERLELLPLLGRLGGSTAKQSIQEALASKDPQLYEAGVRAVCNWPDAAVAEQLLNLAQESKTDTHRLWALRGFIRVVTLPGKTPDAQKLAMLKQAVQLAARDEERGYALERASAVRTVETLRFLLPYLDQPSLAQQACKSVVELARHKELREPNRKEFGPALEKAIKISTDATTLERARRYLQGQ
jgi:HEAT repeat protein